MSDVSNEQRKTKARTLLFLFLSSIDRGSGGEDSTEDVGDASLACNKEGIDRHNAGTSLSLLPFLLSFLFLLVFFRSFCLDSVLFIYLFD
jgi:hypothetical protein